MTQRKRNARNDVHEADPVKYGPDLLEYLLLAAFIALSVAALFTGSNALKKVSTTTDFPVCAQGQVSRPDHPCSQQF